MRWEEEGTSKGNVGGTEANGVGGGIDIMGLWWD